MSGSVVVNNTHPQSIGTAVAPAAAAPNSNRTSSIEEKTKNDACKQIIIHNRKQNTRMVIGNNAFLGYM